MAFERYNPPAGSGGGGSSLPVPLSALDFDAATFSDPSSLLTSWNQTSLGSVSVVYAGTLGSTTPGFRPGASWVWALSDLEATFDAGDTFVIAEIYTGGWPKTSTGAQLGAAVIDNGTIASASGSGHEHYDSGVADERFRGYFATGANGNTGRAGGDYLQVLSTPRPGSVGMAALCSGHATAGDFYQDLVQSTAGPMTHLCVTVGQELGNVSGTFTFRAAAAVLPFSGRNAT